MSLFWNSGVCWRLASSRGKLRQVNCINFSQFQLLGKQQQLTPTLSSVAGNCACAPEAAYTQVAGGTIAKKTVFQVPRICTLIADCYFWSQKVVAAIVVTPCRLLQALSLLAAVTYTGFKDPATFASTFIFHVSTLRSQALKTRTFKNNCICGEI